MRRPCVFRCVAITLFAALLPLMLAQAVHAAVAIDSLSPACGSVGNPVTMTGHGFGASNVRIVVDGITAHVLSATGDTATFVVPPGVHLGPTTVVATNPGGQTGAHGFRICDVVMPDAWAGTWQLTVTYRSMVTHTITQKDVITAFIRPGESFGVLEVAKRVNCTGSISDANFEVHCAGQGSIGSCTVTADVQVSLSRTTATLAGSGARLVLHEGCGVVTDRDDTIEIAGVRLSTDYQGPAPTRTFIQSFVPQAAELVLLLQ